VTVDGIIRTYFRSINLNFQRKYENVFLKALVVKAWDVMGAKRGVPKKHVKHECTPTPNDMPVLLRTVLAYLPYYTIPFIQTFIN
jgi:hypothetical protein